MALWRGAAASDLPSSIQVEITSQCNLTCAMCPLTDRATASSANPGPMQPGIWRRVVGAAAPIGQVIVSGFGEPLLHPEWESLFEDLDSAVSRFSFSTNGFALTDRCAATLATFESLAHVNVSIDSPDPAVYRRVRRDDVNRPLNGLRRLARALRDPSRISVSSILFADSLPSLVRFPALLASLGIRTWVLQSSLEFNPFTGQRHALGTPLADFIVAVREAAAEASVALDFTVEDRIALGVRDAARATQHYLEPPAADAGMTRRCMLPWETPYVDKDGRVFSCCTAAALRDVPLGDLRTSSMTSIWRARCTAVFGASFGVASGCPTHAGVAQQSGSASTRCRRWRPS